jgi:hypothetical protein
MPRRSSCRCWPGHSPGAEAALRPNRPDRNPTSMPAQKFLPRPAMTTCSAADDGVGTEVCWSAAGGREGRLLLLTTLTPGAPSRYSRACSRGERSDVSGRCPCLPTHRERVPGPPTAPYLRQLGPHIGVEGVGTRGPREPQCGDAAADADADADVTWRGRLRHRVAAAGSIGGGQRHTESR